MRTWWIAGMLAPYALALVTMLVQWSQLRRFHAAVPALRTADDLAALRRLASAQMYMSLLALGLLPVPLLVWLVGKFVAGSLTWLDLLLYVVIPLVVVMVVGATAGGAAKAVQSTPAADPTLQGQRDHVIDVWLHRNFPNW